MKLNIKQVLTENPQSQNIIVNGWVRTKRESKGISFIEINDGSTPKNLQVIVEENLPEYQDLIKKLCTGASVNITGILTQSLGSGQGVELKANSVQVIGEAPADYVLQKKRHSFEFLREIAHLRPRTNTFASVFRVKSYLTYAVHSYFHERGFVCVQTPIITGSDCEGAGEMFRVTTLPLNDIPMIEGQVDFSKDFFGKEASLTVSGQLAGETFATALGNIYTFGPTFRAENSNTSRHLAEFWMIEPEMSFCDINGNMDVAEDFLKYLLKGLLDNCTDDMEFFDERISPGIIDNLNSIINSNFVRTTYSDALNKLIESGENFEFPLKWGCDLQSEHEKFLTEKVFSAPVILTDYPKEIKAFYMKLNDDNKTVRAMDVLVPRLGEIIGGSQREENLESLISRITECGLDAADYSWYLDLRRFGSVPHSGFGLGFERLVQFVTGMQNIRDVIAFPRCAKYLNY